MALFKYDERDTVRHSVCYIVNGTLLLEFKLLEIDHRSATSRKNLETIVAKKFIVLASLLIRQPNKTDDFVTKEYKMEKEKEKNERKSVY